MNSIWKLHHLQNVSNNCENILKKMYFKMEMNKYLNESDSDFNDFESVSSELLPEYEKKYV